VRAHAACLLLALGRRARLVAALRAVVGCLAAGCRVAKRRAKPSTFRLLLAPEAGGLS
jgi:hypothetical protein